MDVKDFEKVPNAADAKIDLKRGVVITTTKAVDPEGASSPFGAASFHENDYPLYYYNIKANAAKRVAADKAKWYTGKLHASVQGMQVR